MERNQIAIIFEKLVIQKIEENKNNKDNLKNEYEKLYSLKRSFERIAYGADFLTQEKEINLNRYDFLKEDLKKDEKLIENLKKLDINIDSLNREDILLVFVKNAINKHYSKKDVDVIMGFDDMIMDNLEEKRRANVSYSDHFLQSNYKILLSFAEHDKHIFGILTEMLNVENIRKNLNYNDFNFGLNKGLEYFNLILDRQNESNYQETETMIRKMKNIVNREYLNEPDINNPDFFKMVALIEYPVIKNLNSVIKKFITNENKIESVQFANIILTKLMREDQEKTIDAIVDISKTDNNKYKTIIEKAVLQLMEFSEIFTEKLMQKDANLVHQIVEKHGFKPSYLTGSCGEEGDKLLLTAELKTEEMFYKKAIDELTKLQEINDKIDNKVKSKNEKNQNHKNNL